jgi:MFS family permease
MESREARFVLLTALSHAFVHAVILSVPVLAVAWTGAFSLSPPQTGLLAALAYVGFGSTSLPAGIWSDRKGSPRLITLALLGAGVSTAIPVLHPTMEVLAPCLLAAGLCLGLYHPAGLALLSRETARQGRALGLHGVGGSLGIASGPLATVALLSILPWPWVMAALGTSTLITGLLILAAIPESPPPSSPLPLREAAASLKRGSYLLTLIVFFTAGTAYWGSLTFLPHFLRGDGVGPPSNLPWGAALADYLFPALLALGTLGQFTAGRLSDGTTPEGWLGLLTAAAGVTLTLVGATGLAFLALAFGFLLFSLEPLQNLLVVKGTAPQHRGIAYGLAYVTLFGLGAVGAPLAGTLLTLGGYPLAFGGMGSFLGLSAAAAISLRGRLTPQPIPPGSNGPRSPE